MSTERRSRNGRSATGPRSQRGKREKRAEFSHRFRAVRAVVFGGIQPSLAGEFGAGEWECDEVGTERTWHEEFLRAARNFPGARPCAWSTSRSRLAAREASDFNGCLRRFRAAAAGPRRTQPRSLGWGTAALYYKCAKASRAPRIPERGRSARSRHEPARAQQSSNVRAPELPLRPGRPRAVGCGSAALCSSRLCGQMIRFY